MAYSNRKPFNLFQLLGTTNNTAKTWSLDTAQKLSGISDPDSSQKSKSCLLKRYITKSDRRNNFGAPLPVARSWRSADMPSWWEFVQYLLNTSPSSYDEHWKPASMYCGVCSFPYNRILHFENIENEEKFFAEEMNASDLIQPRWENRNDGGLEKEIILSKYFDLLDDEEVEALYEIYKDDFLMFGYQFKYKHFRFNIDSLVE